MKPEQSFLLRAKRLAGDGRHGEAMQLLATAYLTNPGLSIDILALAYEIATAMPDQSRYAQYQTRYFDFGIKPGDKVLDMGSGHIPFPLATHLADISLEDHSVGRAGVPFRHVDGKSVYECNVENTPFADKEFDFVYCSHVLEHVLSPEAACLELMRIGKRGYIECPKPAKDLFYATGALSNHLWGVECLNGVIVFTEYTEADQKGVGSGVMLDMNCAPRTRREKAVAGFDILLADRLNTMLVWDGEFSFEVRRQKPWPRHVRGSVRQSADWENMESAMSSLSFSTRVLSGVNRLREKIANVIAP